MSRVVTFSRERIYKRLTKTSYKRMEEAYLLAKKLTHDQVYIPHVLASFFAADDDEVSRIARCYGLERDVIGDALEESLNKLPKSPSVNNFAPELDLLIEQGWITASLYFTDYGIRTGHIMFGMLNDYQLRRTLRTISAEFEKIDLENLYNDFAFVLEGSPERGAQAIDGYGTLGRDTVVSSVFISYRRQNRHIVGRMYDRLAEKIGREKVFRDILSIPSGARDFQEVIRNNLARSSVCLVVIGPDWCSLSDDHGQRRIMLKDDVVRTEVEEALRGAGIVVPVLVDEAKMPTEKDVPKSLRSLCRCQAATLRDDPDFDMDVRRLIEHIQRNLDT